MIRATRSSLLAMSLVAVGAACADLPVEVDREAQAATDDGGDGGDKDSPLRMGGSKYKVNSALAHWRRDLEAQLLLRPPFEFAQPSITSISPSTVNRGATITITGSQFLRMTWFGGYSVSFQAGNVRLLVAPVSTTATQIQVVVPALATTGIVRLVSNSTGSVWAESPLPLTVNVPVPTTGTARFVNDSQFEIHSLVVNGQQMIPVGQVLPPGSSFDVVGPGASVPFEAEMGFNLFTYFIWTGTATITNGQTRTVSIPAITAGMALLLGASSALFEGYYLDGNAATHVASIVFYANFSYELFDDGVSLGVFGYSNGTVTAYQSAIPFTVDGRATAIDIPYGSFLLQNGPPSWPIIEYVRQ